LIGAFIERALRGGAELSAVTLARFFSMHIWFLPALILLVIGIHLYLVVRIGISAVPSEED
jgi:quinol-cytochrome oxidoreductase complex cytochrome b subunit